MRGVRTQKLQEGTETQHETLVQAKGDVLGLNLRFASCGLPGWLRRRRICLQSGRLGFNPWVRRISWRGKWQATPVFLPGESHRQKSLAGYRPWGHKESDTVDD